jgi:hypothetical protein
MTRKKFKLIENIPNKTIPSWITKDFQKIVDSKDWGYTVDYGSFEKARFYGGFPKT